MAKKKSNKTLILFRYGLVIICTTVFSLGILAFLARTVVWQGEEWNDKANLQLAEESNADPKRGTLLADDGTVLATTLTFYEVRIDFQNEGTNLDTLAKHLPALCDSLEVLDRGFGNTTSKEWKERFLSQMNKKSIKDRSRVFPVFMRLTSQEYQRLKKFPFFKKKRNQNGLYYNKVSRRAKPYGQMAARSIGNVMNFKDNPGNHGTSGLEFALDSMLYGTPGKTTRVQMNTGINRLVTQPPVPGWDITTTINVAIQDILEQELYTRCQETNAEWGCGIIMEVSTGEIKAISNFDYDSTRHDYVEKTNHVVRGYEPGSVMKPISMIVALHNGTVTDINQRITTGSVFSYNYSTIRDPHGGAALSPREIIATSSNIGMSKLTIKAYDRVPDEFRQTLKELGFFTPLDIKIRGEQTPYFPVLGTKPWDRVSLSRMAFGYSTQIPPLYTCAMYNAIANDGKFVRPRLMKKLSREGSTDSIIPVTDVNENLLSSENAAKLRQMLHDVVWMNEPHHGTARMLQNDLVEIAGKTGTCFIVDPQTRSYGARKRLAFCGFFPYENPKYTCMVLMSKANVGAAASSGTVLKNVALKMYARGMLGNSSDYRNGSSATSTPTLYALADGKGKALRSRLGKAKVIKKTNSPSKGVPNVKNMSLPDALAVLEQQCKMNVSIEGSGFVAQQSIAPGTPFKPGAKIKLYLR